jgi:glycerate-2-kinase
LTHHVLANNATAVDAAGTCAVELGYRYWMHSAKSGDGPADLFGRKFAEQLFMSSRDALVDCLISGGEPTVVLPEASKRGNGGRNQHLVLSAGEWVCSHWSKLAPREFVRRHRWRRWLHHRRRCLDRPRMGRAMPPRKPPP